VTSVHARLIEIIRVAEGWQIGAMTRLISRKCERKNKTGIDKGRTSQIDFPGAHARLV